MQMPGPMYHTFNFFLVRYIKLLHLMWFYIGSCHINMLSTIGSVVLDLNRLPRPAKDAKNCSLKLISTDASVPRFSLFKQKRCKGWWPMEAKDEKSGETELVVITFSNFELQFTNSKLRSHFSNLIDVFYFVSCNFVQIALSSENILCVKGEVALET